MTTSQVAPRWLRRQLNRGARYASAATPDERLWSAYDWFRSVVHHRPETEQGSLKDEIAAYLAGRAAALDGTDTSATPVGVIAHDR